MNCFKELLVGALKVSNRQPLLLARNYTHRRPSYCGACVTPPEQKPCFDMRSMRIELGNPCHTRMIRSFLYAHCWPREPSVTGLWMSLDCPYLDTLTEKYSNSGDRFLAFERVTRTKERKLIGVCVANSVLPWAADELEDWAHYTASTPERHRMYFIAHCYRSSGLFNKYHVPYVYEIEILTTLPEVSQQGVGAALVQAALDHAQELRHPLVAIIAVSQYAASICEECGMKREWSMDYSEFVDHKGQRVFFPRRPHHTVSVYVKYNNPHVPPEEPCLPPY